MSQQVTIKPSEFYEIADNWLLSQIDVFQFDNCWVWVVPEYSDFAKHASSEEWDSQKYTTREACIKAALFLLKNQYGKKESAKQYATDYCRYNKIKVDRAQKHD